MAAGPVVSRLIEQMHDKQKFDRPEHVWHYDQQASMQISIVRVCDGFGNPFGEEGQDILVLDMKEIAKLTALEALVKHARWVSSSLKT